MLYPHLGSKLKGPSGNSATGLASIGATGGITGRSMPPVSGRQGSPTAVCVGRWCAQNYSNAMASVLHCLRGRPWGFASNTWMQT